MAVLNDMSMLRPIEQRHWTLVALSPDIIVSRVDGNRSKVDKQMTDKCNASALYSVLRKIQNAVST